MKKLQKDPQSDLGYYNCSSEELAEAIVEIQNWINTHDIKEAKRIKEIDEIMRDGKILELNEDKKCKCGFDGRISVLCPVHFGSDREQGRKDEDCERCRKGFTCYTHGAYPVRDKCRHGVELETKCLSCYPEDMAKIIDDRLQMGRLESKEVDGIILARDIIIYLKNKGLI